MACSFLLNSFFQTIHLINFFPILIFFPIYSTFIFTYSGSPSHSKKRENKNTKYL